MGGLVGIVSKEDCMNDLFYMVDYHSHLGTEFGGIAVKEGSNLANQSHMIRNAQFRSTFANDVNGLKSDTGIGVVSDYYRQPFRVESHLGEYAMAIVGKINNMDEIVKKALAERRHFVLGRIRQQINPIDIVADLIDEKDSFEEGIKNAQNKIDGSCSMLILTKDGIYAARDKVGRTPLVLGKKESGYAVVSETCSFINQGFKRERDLGPGEIVFITRDGVEQKQKPGDKMRICSFLWIYYGNPASNYEGINVEMTRYRCGAVLARRDSTEIDTIAGIPDSGTAHAIGTSHEKRNVFYTRPTVKYTETWQRSFMPQEQEKRDLVAEKKQLPIEELIRGQSLLFNEDSIVRGTQLKKFIQRLFEEFGAKEVHMRPACPPLVHGCRFLNFSRSKSELDLAARKAITELEGTENVPNERLAEYTNPNSEKYHRMVDVVKRRFGLTSLQYQRLDDMIEAIGLPREKLCTYCWTGED